MSSKDQRCGVAIIGMACLFPRAPDLAGFWNNILQSVDAVGEPLPAWQAERYQRDSLPESDRLYTTSGGFLNDLFRFDPMEFGIMPSAIDGGEPDQFLALKIARDALLDAGYLEADHTNTGIILGHSTYLHRGNASVVQHGVVLDQTVSLLGQLFPDTPSHALAKVREYLREELPPFNADVGPGLVPNVMTGRIANRLNFKGPNYLIDAACASSLLSVQSAMEELRQGRSDLMLAGGVNASMPAEVLIVFTHLGALSRRSRVRPFDAGSDGTLLGEGLGTVVLKRYEDAVRDGDRIYAVLRGVGQSSDGKGLGLLAPRREGEELALRRAYSDSGLDPSSIGLIEAHGTGIPLGDKTEIEALTSIFGAREGELPRTAIGSVKSMISHCIPAAGIAGLIKTSLALYHRVLPPSLCDELNPALGMEATPFYVNTSTRPWVHPAGTPRRAAVNAFGFGGINAHAILEEPPDQELRSLTAWSSELALFQAENRDALLQQVERAIARLQEGAALAPLCSALALELAEASGEFRLAVVADDAADLEKKLQRVAPAIADPGRERYQARNGIFFRSQPLEGDLAVLFPGEGAQHADMLSELCQAFPEVRGWFDFWDGVYSVAERGVGSSSVVFTPPSAVSNVAREHTQNQLFSLEFGSESMFIANQAMNSLLGRLGVRADAMLGHSSGENSALVAAGVVPLENDKALREHIRGMNEMYQRIETAGDVATGALLTVGAVERDKVLQLVEASDGEIDLALDNCHHQAVLYGSSSAIDRAAEALREMGGLCQRLPFNRAYHTPKFKPVSRALNDFFRDIPLVPARIPLYSCASADRFPAERDAIRDLMADQWSSRVRFIETIEKMYADGVRFFMEIGPAGNLTSFVDDILRDREHIAVSTNHRTRGDLQQLMHALGRLHVSGREWAPRALFEGRQIARISLATPLAPPVLAPLLRNELPWLQPGEDRMDRIRELLGTTVSAAPENPVPETDRGSRTDAASASHPGAVLGQHFSLMQEFLASQQRILEHALRPAADLPFLHRIVEQSGDHVRVEVDLESTAGFLRDHTLYAHRVSAADPNLGSLPVVPFSVSLEILCEAAALLSGKPHLAAVSDVRAYNWIALEESGRTIQVSAERKADAPAEREHFRVRLSDGDAPLVEGTVEFTDEAPSGLVPVPALDSPEHSHWKDGELYTTGMFHGPLYHSIAHLDGWNASGIDAQLNHTPLEGFFVPGQTPSLLTNPVLLDAVGHATAFWIAQRIGTDFSSFPSRVERLEFVEANPAQTADALLAGRFDVQEANDARDIRGDFSCQDKDGNMLFRIDGWHDRFLDVPHSFYAARMHAREGWYGEDWTSVVPKISDDTLVWYLPAFPAGFLEEAGELWKRVLLFTLCGPRERAEWSTLNLNPQQRGLWLMTRVAVKEAARAWIQARSGELLYPADLILQARKEGGWQVICDPAIYAGPLPDVAVCQRQGDFIAAAVPGGRPLGIDLALVGSEGHDAAVTAAARAAVRSRGQFPDAGTSIEIAEIGADGQHVVVRAAGESVSVLIGERQDHIVALA